jgi:hypothetical protein
MKRRYRASVFLVLCSSLTWLSGCESLPFLGPSGPPPILTFEKLEHDFGEIPPNTLKKVQFKFTNTGEGVLKINKVDLCCGVVAKLAGNKKKYAAGESGTLEVEFTSGPKPVLFNRELVVHSNDRVNPKIQIGLKAKIVLSLTWEPTRLKLMLDRENAGCPDITIGSLDDKLFSLTGFKSTGDLIKAELDPSIKATEFVLEPKVDMDKLSVNLKGNITIGIDHTDGNAIGVPFEVLPKYTVSPKELVLFGSTSGKPIVKKISVVSNYDHDFEIESMVSKSVAIKVLRQREIDAGYELDLEIMLQAYPEEGLYTDEFSIQIKGGEKLTIPCRIWYMKKS